MGYTIKEHVETLPIIENANDQLRSLVYEGLKKRGFHNDEKYVARIEEELDVIIALNFAGYFIVLFDILNYARENGIIIGPARGSGASSLVNYCLYITHIDPIEYDLLFYRFLNPWRAEYPDIDVDVSPKGRPKLKEYIENKYGSTKVASIATYSYFGGKSAFKRACSALDVPYAIANKVAASIEHIDDLMAFPDFMRDYPRVYELAQALDGRIANNGIHPAATIISNLDLTDIASTATKKIAKDEFRQLYIEYDMNEVEKMGFVKYDFLGLLSLDVISDACKIIKETHGIHIDPLEIDKNDPHVIAMLAAGHTVGVFQASSKASTDLIKKMNIKSFNDLVASNALVRPGAMKAFGEEYIAIANGKKKVKPIHPDIDPYLKDTYNLYLFQEQTMQLCMYLANVPAEDADAIRKLTAKKKDKELLQPYKNLFLAGASPKVGDKVAEKLWKDIELTAEYSFNKCLDKDTKVNVKVNNNQYLWTLDQVNDYFATGGSDLYVLGPSYIKAESAGGFEWYEVKAIHDNGVQDIYRIHLSDVQYIDSTSTHRHRTAKAWKQVHQIHQTDVICTMTGNQRVQKREFIGQSQTYDLELYDEKHAFYANGVITHNSHSVAYSFISMMGAWLKYYYPAEYIAAMLNNPLSESSVQEALIEAKRLGIKVNTPNIHTSKIGYSVTNGEINMGFDAIKYITDKSGQRLMQMRDEHPFESYEDLLARSQIVKSGISSRIIESLGKVGALVFDDYEIDEKYVQDNLFEYLGIYSTSSFLTHEMMENITPINEYEEGDAAIISGTITDIVSKGWTRIDITDGTEGKLGLFVDPQHSFVKKNSYVFAIADKQIINYFSTSEDVNESNAILRYLNGDFNEGTWIVAGKLRKTQKGTLMGNFIVSNNGVLYSMKAFGSSIGYIYSNGQWLIKPGTRVKIQVSQTEKWGMIIERIVKNG